LAYIQEGFQKGSNNSGEFLEILKEYPTQFKAAGIDAGTMFSIINSQVKQGIYSDKGVDAIKEGGLRLRENTKAVQDALKPLDESVKLQIKQEIAAGRSFNAIKLVSKELSNTNLTAQQTQTIIADVFGGAGEDAGLAYLKTLKDVQDNLKGVADQTTEVEKANIKLSESFNNFVQGVSDGGGIISQTWANLLKGTSDFLNDLNAMNDRSLSFPERMMGWIDSLSRVSPLLYAVNEKIKSFFNIDEKLAKIKFQRDLKDAKERGTASGKAEYEANKKAKEGEDIKIKKNNIGTPTIDKSKKESERLKQLQYEYDLEQRLLSIMTDEAVTKLNIKNAAFISSNDEILNSTLSTNDLLKKNAKELSDYNNQLRKTDSEAFIASEKEKIKSIEESWEAVKENLINETIGFAKTVFAQSQDEKMNRFKEDAEIEKDILKDKLDKKVITEKQYNDQITKLNQKVREQEAKAAKKKAIFDILIESAVAVVKSILKPWLIPAILANTAIQVAAVAAVPIPAYAEGTDYVNGPGTETSDSIPAKLSKGERIVPANINKQLAGISNKDLPKIINSGMNTFRMEALLNEVNSNTMESAKYLSAGMNFWQDRDFQYFKEWKTGSTIIKPIKKGED